jgi:hypothetical protein
MQRLLLLTAFALASATAAAPAAAADARTFSGRVAVAPVDYAVGSMVTVEASRHQAGDVVPPGQSVVAVRSYDREVQIASLQDSLLAVRIDLLNAKKISDLNALALDDAAGPKYDEKTRRAILKLDVIELLQARQEALRRQIDALARTQAGEGGLFSYPVMLLDRPIRSGQQASAGTPLFQYVPLDSLQVAIGIPEQGGPPPGAIGVRLDKEVVRLRYVRRLVSPARGAECLYAGEIPSRLSAALADLYRNPGVDIPVFEAR